MGVIEKTKRSVPLEELEGVDEMFFRQIQMQGDKVLKKFKSEYEETKEKIYSAVSAECIYQSFKIQGLAEGIELEGGERLDSKMLKRAFKNSDELVICAITLHGHEPLEAAEKAFMKTFFLDGWGTALVECGFSRIKKQIGAELAKERLHTTCSWSPGQHNVDIGLQKVLFRLLGPEEIGMTLNKSCMMHPKKSISGFFGIGSDPDIEQIRACDFCERRSTCPTAYS